MDRTALLFWVYYYCCFLFTTFFRVPVMQRREGEARKGQKVRQRQSQGTTEPQRGIQLATGRGRGGRVPGTCDALFPFYDGPSPNFSANCKYARELQKSCLKMGQAEAMHFSVVIDPALRQSQFGYVTQPTCHYLALA